MGFTDGLGRLLSGKPYFTNDANSPSDVTNKQSNHSGPKYNPELIVGQSNYNHDDDVFNVSVDIKNNSNVDLFINSISLLGASKDINLIIKPGEARGFNNVHKGTLLKHDNYKYCEVFYRTLAGDNFKTVHSIDYESRGDGIYHIKNIRYLAPVRDINGNN